MKTIRTIIKRIIAFSFIYTILWWLGWIIMDSRESGKPVPHFTKWDVHIHLWEVLGGLTLLVAVAALLIALFAWLFDAL